MDVDVPASDVALMLRVRAGDETAFETLHQRYQPRLLNFFFGMSRNVHTASDLCQETFLRVWRLRKRYRATGSFPGYLFAIARLIWLERQREQRKERYVITPQVSESVTDVATGAERHPDVLATRSEMEERIYRALDELPLEQRLVFVLRTVQGLSLDDIAAALDCPVNTVRSRKILAIKKMRHLLSKVFISALDRTI